MTIKVGKFANLIVRNFVVIWEAPNIEGKSMNKHATQLYGQNCSNKGAVAPVRFGLVVFYAWDGSSGSGFQFRRFLAGKGFLLYYNTDSTDRNGSGSGFGSCKTVPTVPVPQAFQFLPTKCSDGSGFRLQFGSWATL